MALRNAVQLICYPDRMGQNLTDLAEVLECHLGDAIGGVHLLPFYPSNADAGFAPLTHKEVDPRFGSWRDIRRIAARYDLCVDLILNHISDQSPQFRDFIAQGYDSPSAELFVHVERMGEISHDDLARIHIRKEKEPFREVQFANGGQGRVWCTFTEHQIDLNFEAPATHRLIADYIAFLAEQGVKLFRLDAFGYISKRIGTRCFMVEPDIYHELAWVQGVATAHGVELLPEVHDHISYQYEIGRRGMHPYGFALPPLVLHALLDANSRYLKQWLRMCPRNQVTVLDSHDGICIPDVEGLLPESEIKALIDNIDARSGDPILRGSAANVHSVGAIYQLTCTFYDALQRQDDAYIAARAIQFFTPGIPQVYYVGWLAGENDLELLQHSGDARGINRHYFALEEVAARVQRPVVQRLLALMRFRSHYPAFDGEFELHSSSDTSVRLGWRNDDYYCELFVDLRFRTTRICHWDPAAGQQCEQLY